MLNQGDKFGKYTIVKRIGLDERGNSTGAFAMVYVVSHKAKEYVLKIPNNQERVNNLLREIGNWARVSLHPNILTFHEAVADEGKIGFISEYIQTGSLKDWLKNSENLTLLQKLSMIEGILSGLEHLHQNSILHRDLKPDNVFVKDGIPLLADFGSAKDYDFAESQHAYGFTYWYAPPELVAIYDEFGVVAKYQLTEFDDLWSVSVIISEILTGQYPFDRMSKIMTAEMRPFPPNTDQRIIEFVQKALQKDRNHRFQTVKDMRENLKNPQGFLAPKVEDAGTIIDEDFVEPESKPDPATTSTNPDSFKNSIGMEFVKIPSGSFMMGSPQSEKDRGKDEGLQRRVTINNEFYLGKYEVTQVQWKAIMGNNPSKFQGDNLPVEQVSWDETQEFIKKLNAKGEEKYRLPTEAEWEYAARGGKDGDVFGIGDGKNLSSEQANFDGNYPYGNAAKGKYLQKTVNVGSYQPNKFGLYDMHGNVWEWCEDIYKDSYSGLSVDGSANVSQGDLSWRVLRGGSWVSYGYFCRSAYRYRNAPALRDLGNGFRLIRVSE